MTEDEMVGWHHQLNKKQTLALEILYGICVHKIFLIVSTICDGETVADFIFLGSKITADGDCSHEIKRCLLLGRKVNKKQRHYSVNKDPSSQGYGFSSSHVWM